MRGAVREATGLAVAVVRAEPARASERRRPVKAALRDPAVREVLQAVAVYARTRRQERALQVSLEKVEAVGEQIRRGERAAGRASELDTGFRRELARAYVRAEEARAEFLRLATEQGGRAAGAAMRREPGQFGELRAEARPTKGYGRVKQAARAGAPTWRYEWRCLRRSRWRRCVSSSEPPRARLRGCGRC